MKLPEERASIFAPKIRNLTCHKVEEVKVRTQTHDAQDRLESGCEIVLDIRGKTRVDPRLDIVLIPGEFTDEIESEGLEAALTSDDERLRSVAILMREFTEKKLRVPRNKKTPPSPRRRFPKDIETLKDEDGEEIDFDDCDF